MLHPKNKISTGALHVKSAFSHRWTEEEDLFQTAEVKKVSQEWESEIQYGYHLDLPHLSLSIHQAILHTTFYTNKMQIGCHPHAKHKAFISQFQNLYQHSHIELIVIVSLLLLLLLSRFSHVRFCATTQTATHQAPPSLGFSRQEYWSGLPFPSPIHESEVVQSCLTLSNPLD